MKMSDIKFPKVVKGSQLDEKEEIRYNPSSLYAYLGWRGTRTKNGGEATKNE